MLLRLRGIPFGALAAISPDRFSEQMSCLLDELYPQKSFDLGEVGRRRLIADGLRAAEETGLRIPEGVGAYTLLMFILGSHFARDPLYPWAATTLGARSDADPSLRAGRLYEQAVARLNQHLSTGSSESRG
jgi:hypothetical protein